MLSGVFDPFSRLSGEQPEQDIFPSIHIGVIKSYIASTNSAMVLVPTINSGSEIGPCKVMRPYGMPPTTQPTKGQKVVIALIDGSLNSAVVLGYL